MKEIALSFLLVLCSATMIGGFIVPAEASGTIFINADGSVSPSTADITSVDNVTYTFTNNNFGSVVVQRDNMVINGAGYTLQGTRRWNSRGIDLTGRSNVTLKNIEIREFFFGIWLKMSSNNNISRNKITANKVGICLSESSNITISGNKITSNMNYNIYLEYSSNNNISGNKITAKGKLWEANLYYSYFGLYLYYSSTNHISGNNITNNGYGIELSSSSNNSIPRNNIADNTRGILLWKSSSNAIYGNNITNNDYGIVPTNSSKNIIHRNNFVGNTNQVYSYSSANVWDDGYPSGGNYWSDYDGRYPEAKEMGESGIWDTPYLLDESNRDNCPLMNPWIREKEPVLTEEEEVPLWMQWRLWTIAALGAAVSAAVYFMRKRKPPIDI